MYNNPNDPYQHPGTFHNDETTAGPAFPPPPPYQQRPHPQPDQMVPSIPGYFARLPRKDRNWAIGFFICLAVITVGLCANAGNPNTATAMTTPTATVQQVVKNVPPTLEPTNTPVPTPVPPTPTQKPTPTPIPPTPTPIPPTPTPVPEPTQPPAPQLFIDITSASAVNYSYGSVSVQSLPGAALTITVTYCTGRRATSSELQGTHYADGGGYYTWNWVPETKCPGPATASVTASFDGQYTSNSTQFTVG